MWGHKLSDGQKIRKLEIDLLTMGEIQAAIKWVSIEPLSWPCADLFKNCELEWAAIGAASSGPAKHQPNQTRLEDLLQVLDVQRIPVFFKGNLHYEPRREEFPI
jgi:protein gp37